MLKFTRWLLVLTYIFHFAQVGAQQSGFLNVNVGTSPTISDTPQPISLYGCNNTQVDTEVFWDTQNQVVGDIPYGPRVSESNKPYFLSKYYVASPPAWRGVENHIDPFIGLVIPDNFQFVGERPAQILNLDYRILKSTWLKDVPVDFTRKYGELPSCKAQGVTSIPINTSCADFPWQIGALGASGIGLLNDKPLKDNGSTAFLPFLDKEFKEPLQCTVTLLDDIFLHHEIFFVNGEEWSKTIDLTALYQEKGTMELVCVAREPEDYPAGCVAP